MSTPKKSSSDITENTDKANTSQENKKSTDNKKIVIEENKPNINFIRRRVWPD